ncbi:MAG: 50S ribosomal protein L24 [Firmicutes bacterium]|jgi:large subunit ribosomal protein L24|nr:50S ribosomal protein L24 [Bacillota bacterium]
MVKFHVKSGDRVELISGDDRGKRGKILEVRPKAGKVIVEGINIQKKHTRPTQTNPQGGIIDTPGPVDISNVMLVCPHCTKATRVARVRDENGKALRQCKKCGKNID